MHTPSPCGCFFESWPSGSVFRIARYGCQIHPLRLEEIPGQLILVMPGSVW